MGPFDAATIRRFCTLAQWKTMARKAKDDPTAELVPGVSLGEAVIIIPGRIDAAKALDPEKETVEFVVSGSARDRDGDTVDPQGWRLTNYRKNPVVLYGHDYWGLPIAKALSIGVQGQELVANDAFAEARKIYELANTVYLMLQAKLLNAVSAGFNPIKWLWNQEAGGYDFAEQELYEHSVVPVPAYADALQRGIAAGIDVQPLRGWAEAILDKIAGQPGLWLPREGVQRMLKALTGNPVLVTLAKEVPQLAGLKQGDGGTSGDDPNAVTPNGGTAATGNGVSVTDSKVCAECGAVNDAGAATCSECGKPMKAARTVRLEAQPGVTLALTAEKGALVVRARKGAGDAPSASADVPPGNSTGGSEVAAGEGTEWTCPCGQVNKADATVCAACGKERPKAAAAPAAKTGKDGGKPCPTCGAMNPMDATACSVCGNPMQASPATPTADSMDATLHAIGETLTKVSAALEHLDGRLKALETKGTPAPATAGDAIDQLLAEINAAPAPIEAIPELEDVSPEDLKAALGDVVRQAVDDVTQQRLTAITGRLPD